ncbi:hypothetical protein [Catenulispora pinisilvae]|uniref:hypothetical protein n=2 Tax=Catenulispora pinisilvae TaxID=2705253 RepID=UPI0018925BDE|nr:hypothetical protein [Catenulispora pinisilvae]
MTTMWTRQAIDAAIDRRALERSGVSAGLLELDDHPGRRLLDGAKLTGATAQSWAKASAELAGLWTVFEAYQQVLDRVSAMRGGPKTKLGDRELAAMADLLTGRSVELPRQAVPFERRGLLDPASTQDLLTLDEAVESMARTYDMVKKVAVDAENAWNRLLEPLDDLQAKARAARATADQVGAGGDPVFDRLAGIEKQVSDMRRQALTDPLGMVGGASALTPARVAGLLGQLADVQTELDQALVARTEFDQRLAGLQDVIVRIARAEAEAEQVRVTVREKIAAPKLPPASAAAAHLRGKVAELERERSGQSWTLLGRNLSALEKNSRLILENAQKRIAQIREPLDRRDELRGLLEAYRARAARHGVAEAPVLTALYQSVHDRLWSAPCDLTAAEAGVREYLAAVGAALPSMS